jgi:putative MATE family efflux protein
MRKTARSAAMSLIDGDIRRQLVALTVPMTWGVFASMAFNLADTYFVGQLGARELAAMSFTFPVVMVLVSLAIGLGAGTSSVVARAVGERDEGKMRRLTTDSLLLSGSLSLVLACLGALAIDPLFRLLGAKEEVLPLIHTYMLVWYSGLLFLILAMVGFSATRATGDARTPSLMMMAAAVLNVVLDPILIFGHFGVPRLGLVGAGVAGTCARFFLFVSMIAVVRYRDGMLSFTPPKLDQAMTSWRSILHVGLPAAGTNMVIPLSSGVITALIATYGAEAVAGFGVATRIESVALVFFYALSGVMNPFVGQNAGARRFDRVGEAARQSARFCLAFGALLTVVLGVCAPWLASAINHSPAVVEVATTYLRLVPLSYGAAGLVMVINASFNGLGRPLPAVFISVLRVLVVYLPLAFLGSRLFGVAGIFAAAAVSNAVVGFIAYRLHLVACRESPALVRADAVEVA